MKKPLHQPKPQANSQPPQSVSPSNKYFKVFYSKDVNKKKKIYSEGVLTWENNKTKLYNTDGEVLVQVNEKNAPEIDQEYVVGYKYVVLIDSQFDKESFTSGRVFIAMVDGTMDNLLLTTKNQTKPPPKAQKKPLKANQAKQQTKLADSNPVKTEPNNKEKIQLENGLIIDNMIYSKLREHQIQGVQFMYNCLMGYKSPSICGCILADFMGLGKTLQTLTLIYSLLKMKKISKCIVISPLTLVYVWEKQSKKWLDNKLRPLIALGDGQEVKNVCKSFADHQYRMLVLSYEGFYRFIDILENKCDLIVFDEGHRLKNKNSKAYKKILNFSCRKRVLLTGTPLQNNLEELYTCISIVNPSMFPSEHLFNNVFQKPILNGMAKNATQIERKIAIERTIELANKIKQFSLRRKADTLEKYLPIKRQYFVLFKLTPLQKLWYERLLKRKQTESDVLGFLNLFRKLFTHPQILKLDRLEKADTADFVENSIQQVSFKLNFVLDVCQKAVQKDQKVIVVSYFTSTLDFIGKILKDNGISFVKLDGKVDGKDRQAVVSSFQREKNVLLLSGKAGGTGLTLVTARTMVILEPDWNPSNDAQVIGRIWRQGQTHEVAIYRLVIISSFEQRIIERQQLKNALSEKLIDENKSASTGYDFMDMKKLFVQPSQKSILFKQSENVLDKVYLGSGLKWQGVILAACKMSHGKENNEQSFKGQGEKMNKIEQSNEFADGMLLFEGLIEDGEDKQIEADQETQNNEKMQVSCNESRDKIFNQQSKAEYNVPVKKSIKREKRGNELIVQKQVEAKYIDAKQVEVNLKKLGLKGHKLKKYDIVEMDEHKRFSESRQNKKIQRLDSQEVYEKQQPATETQSQTIENPSNQTIVSAQHSQVEDPEGEVKSKKGQSLVLNKLKLKKKNPPQEL